MRSRHSQVVDSVRVYDRPGQPPHQQKGRGVRACKYCCASFLQQFATSFDQPKATGGISPVLRRTAYWTIRPRLKSCRFLPPCSQSYCFHQTRVPWYHGSVCFAAWSSVIWRPRWFRSIRMLICILEGTHWSRRNAALRVTYNMVAPWCRALPIAKHLTVPFCGATPLVCRSPTEGLLIILLHTVTYRLSSTTQLLRTIPLACTNPVNFTKRNSYHSIAAGVGRLITSTLLYLRGYRIVVRHH
jgi:hypothetical protein